MKGRICIAGMMLALAGSALAQIVVTLPETSQTTMIKSEHVLLDDMLKARSENDIMPVVDSVSTQGHRSEIAVAAAGPARYRLEAGPDRMMDLYTSPGEKIEINVVSMEPFDYVVTGSPLMEGVQELNRQLTPVETSYAALMQRMRQTGNVDEAALDSLSTRFQNICFDFIKRNPDSPAVAYAVTNLSGEECVDAFESMSDGARASALYPFAQGQYAREKERVAAERARNAMVNGHVEAPAFTLEAIDGSRFSLDSLRGKYVIIDFWGSWCIWCIKGFPELKATYEKYKDSLAVVGVDCGDTPDKWKAAVAKYELPWINVYNPDQKGSGLLASYNVQGFPTKVLVDPEGKIVDIAVGEDPSFYTRLQERLAK